MRITTVLAASTALALAAALASADTPASHAYPMPKAVPPGYLDGHEPDTVAVVEPAPAPGSPRDLADREIFRRTRALEGSPRWGLATHDAELSIPDLLADFSCAVGVKLTPRNVPGFSKVVLHAIRDMAAAYDRPKDLYKRPRPYLRDAGPICVPRSAYLDKSYDYPSGHATWAWSSGLMLAEIAPERAGLILQRARAFGESRTVCGVHSASAVEAGRNAGSALFAALNGDSAFRADEAAAGRELAALRASPAAEKPTGCEAEAALTARTPW